MLGLLLLSPWDWTPIHYEDMWCRLRRDSFFRRPCREFTNMYRVVVLQPGYSIMEEDGSMKANGTSTLVVSSYHITLSKLAEALTKIHGSDWRGACGVGWHPFSLGQRTPTVFTGRGRANSRRCHPSCKVLSLICSSFVSWIEPVICLTITNFSSDVWRFAPMAIQTMWATTTCSPQQRCKV